jgi:L-seryl-tRNA(Ser) seleniumtransferase
VTPHYSWHIASSKLKITGPEVMQKLADSRPIGIGRIGANSSGMHGRDPDAPTTPAPARRNGRFTDLSAFGFAVWQIKEGEDKIIAERLVEIFSEAPKAS